MIDFDPEHFASEDGGFDASQLTAMKTLLHQVNQEHMELKSQLEVLLEDHSTVLGEYAEHSLELRNALKQARKGAKDAVSDARLKALEEKKAVLDKLYGYKEPEVDSLALRLFKNELYKLVLSSPDSTPCAVSDYEVHVSAVKPISVRRNAFKLFGFIKDNYSPSYGQQLTEAVNSFLSIEPSTEEWVELYLNECELFTSFFIWKGENLKYDWLSQGRDSFSRLVVDPFIEDCEKVQAEYDAMALDKRTSEKLNQRILYFLQIIEEFAQGAALNDEVCLRECISIVHHKVEETIWNVVFAYQMIDSDAIPAVLGIIDHFCDVVGRYDPEAPVERMRCLHWVLGMNLMQIMNAYRRDKLTLLKPAELIAIISAIFSSSSLKSACLSEIEQDLLDSTNQTDPEEDEEAADNTEDLEF